MKKRWKVLCCALLAGSLCACGSAGDEGEDREVTLILDYVPNASARQIAERGETFFRILRDAHPDVPVSGRTVQDKLT